MYNESALKIARDPKLFERRMHEAFLSLSDDYAPLFMNGLVDYKGKRIISTWDPTYTLQWALKKSSGDAEDYEGSPERGFVCVVICATDQSPQTQECIPTEIVFNQRSH